MKKLKNNDFKHIENWLINSGRDIEVAIYNHAFFDEDKQMILDALTLYQNSDGGFGNGLEPDSLNPNSSPIQTYTALDIIYDVGFRKDSNNELLCQMLNKAFRYLYTKAPMVDGKWCLTIPSNNDFPCAIWWKHDETKQKDLTYNPTAAIIGFTLVYLDVTSKYYKKALKMVDDAFRYYLSKLITDKHEMKCFITLINCLKEMKINHPLLIEVEQKLQLEAYKIAEKDESKWAKDYPNLVIDIFNNDRNMSDELKELFHKNLDFLIEHRPSNGLWDITWLWYTDYPEYEVSRLKWTGVLAVKYLRLLKNHQRIEGIETWMN